MTTSLQSLSTFTLVKLAARAKLKQLESWFIPRYPGSFWMGLPRTDYNYAGDVGDGLSASVVTPVIHWLQRAFPEAPLVVQSREGDEVEMVDNHPLVQLVDRPNAFYPGTLLWMTTLSDWCWFGESFWRILHQRGGQPGELWWLPPWSVTPQWPSDGSTFISHYDYAPDQGTKIRLELEEVIHFRHGLDPRNPRHGLPPLRAVVREIWGDCESSNWVAALLRNMGIPGMVLSPKGETSISREEVEVVKAYVAGRFTGDQRGQPLALGSPTQVDRLSWSPHEMDLTVVRNTAEERVCAALGIPAAVVGFHSGLDNTKVGATMHEFVRLAWSNGVVPLQRLMAQELQRVLLPQFELNPDAFLVSWDYDEVSALEPDQNELAERYKSLWLCGLLKKSEARQALGYETTPEDDIYAHPTTITVVDPADQMPEPEPLLALPGAVPLNGNGANNGARNGAPAIQRRALKQGTLEELVQGLIGRQAGRLDRIPPQLLRLATRMSREEHKLQPRLQALILPALRHYGEMAAVAAREILIPQKQELEDLIRASVILERIPFVAVRAELAEVFATLYDQMLETTLTLLREAMDLEPTDRRRLESQLRLTARERVGLLDLNMEARNAILRALEESRQQGLDESQMVELIRHRVPSGRWTSPEVRAQIMARSESRFSANLATSRMARDMGTHRVLVLDARLGPTDAECEARNGWVVSPSEAEMLSGIEHPNGTLSLMPLSDQFISS